MLRNPEGKSGEFQEKDHGKWFTYQETENPWALLHGITHEVDVLDGTRPAKILKTRVYVCVDEDAQGNPVFDRWEVKNHTVYFSKAK